MTRQLVGGLIPYNSIYAQPVLFWPPGHKFDDKPCDAQQANQNWRQPSRTSVWKLKPFMGQAWEIWDAACRQKHSWKITTNTYFAWQAYQYWEAASRVGRERQFSASNFLNNATLKMVAGMRMRLVWSRRAPKTTRVQGGAFSVPEGPFSWLWDGIMDIG